MSCQQLETSLIDLAAGEALDPGAAEALESHLAACERCAKLASEYQQTIALCRLPTAAQPELEQLAQSTLRALREEPKNGRGRRAGALLLAGALGAAAAVVALSITPASQPTLGASKPSPMSASVHGGELEPDDELALELLAYEVPWSYTTQGEDE